MYCYNHVVRGNLQKQMAENTLSITNIANINTAEIVRGEGDPIVFLHGWGADSSLILPLADLLIPLGYRVYIPDLPGFGQTEEPPTAWSVFDYAEFVLAYLDHHQLEKVFLFGHSFGGRLGLILGSDHRSRIKKMMLANAAGIRPEVPASQQLRLKTYKSIRDGLSAIGAKGLSDWLRKQYNTRYGSSDFNNTSGVMRSTFVQVINQDLLNYAERVQVPTLLFWGDQDEETPLWMGEKLEKTIPDAGLVVLEGAGHYSYIQKNVKTAQIINFFLKQSQ